MKIKILIIILFTSANLFSQHKIYEKNIDSLSNLIYTDATKAILFANELLEKPSLNDTLIAEILYKRGAAYQQLSNQNQAIIDFQKAKKSYQKNQKTEKVLLTDIQIAIALSILNKQNKAIDIIFNVLKQAESIKNTKIIANAYASLSHIYYSYNDWDNAIKYLKKSELMQLQNNDLKSLSSTYNNLAILYKNKNNFKLALEYNHKSLKINQQQKDIFSVAKSYNNIGLVYYKEKKYEKATIYFQKAVAINDSLKVNNSNPIQNIAAIYKDLKDYKKEQIFLVKALHLEKENHQTVTLKNINNLLLINALFLKDFSKAMHYKTTNDSLEAIINQTVLEDKIAVLDSQSRLFAKETELLKAKQNNQLIIIISIVLFLIAFSLVVFFKLREKNRSLKTSQEQIKMEQKVLRAQMNPHFIFNVLSAIQNSILEKNTLESATHLSNFAKLIRQNFDFIQKEKISLTEDLEALSNYVKAQQLRFHNKFDYKITIDSTIDTDEVLLPPMMLQPFVENAIEHGLSNITYKGLIEIEIKNLQNKLFFTIIDNGIGYTPTEMKREHALKIVQKRLQLLGKNDEKSLIIKNNITQGTRVQFTISYD